MFELLTIMRSSESISVKNIKKTYLKMEKARNEITGHPKAFSPQTASESIDKSTGHYKALYPLFTGLQGDERFQMAFYLLSFYDRVDCFMPGLARSNQKQTWKTGGNACCGGFFSIRFLTIFKTYQPETHPKWRETKNAHTNMTKASLL